MITYYIILTCAHWESPFAFALRAPSMNAAMNRINDIEVGYNMAVTIEGPGLLRVEAISTKKSRGVTYKEI